MVKEVADGACREYGFKFGFYLFCEIVMNLHTAKGENAKDMPYEFYGLLEDSKKITP